VPSENDIYERHASAFALCCHIELDDGQLTRPIQQIRHRNVHSFAGDARRSASENACDLHTGLWGDDDLDAIGNDIALRAERRTELQRGCRGIR
jgi:hypothetical protein